MVFNVLLLIVLLKHCQGRCHHVTNEGHLEFTEDLTSWDIAETKEYREIDCCAKGYDNLSWYHEVNGVFKPFQPPPETCAKCPTLDDNNKTLEIRAVGEADGGLYMCVASNKTSGQTISHNTTLDVVACDSLSGPPKTFPPSGSAYVELHDNVTFICKAYYGCNSADDGFVTWYKGYSLQELTDERYKVTEFKRENGTVKGAVLTITDVREEDYNVTFLCDVSTTYIKPKEKLRFPIVLEKKGNVIVSVFISHVYIVLLAVLVPSVLLTAIIVIVWCIFGARISFFFRSRICIGRIPGKGDKTFHVFIYHIEDDAPVVSKTTLELEKRFYKVSSLLNNVAPGEATVRVQEEVMDDSFSKLFIVPKEERMSQEEKNAFKIVLYSSKTRYDPAFTILLLEMDKGDCIKKHYLYNEMSGLFVMRLISDKAMDWQKKEFYSKIQHRLPKPDRRDETIREDDVMLLA